MKGRSDERKEAKSAIPSPMAQDELVAGGAAKAEHYEIAGSASPIDQARAMERTGQSLADSPRARRSDNAAPVTMNIIGKMAIVCRIARR